MHTPMVFHGYGPRATTLILFHFFWNESKLSWRCLWFPAEFFFTFCFIMRLSLESDLILTKKMVWWELVFFGYLNRKLDASHTCCFEKVGYLKRIWFPVISKLIEVRSFLKIVNNGIFSRSILYFLAGLDLADYSIYRHLRREQRRWQLITLLLYLNIQGTIF